MPLESKVCEVEMQVRCMWKKSGAHANLQEGDIPAAETSGRSASDDGKGTGNDTDEPQVGGLRLTLLRVCLMG